MFEFLLIDLDDTILDFHKAEQIALRKTLEANGIQPTEENCALYSRINQAHWEALERQEMTREQVMVGRFAVLFRELGITADPQACSDLYMENLGKGHYFLPGAEEAVAVLATKYKLYLASNGTKTVQASRLESSGLRKYFQDVFISEDMGADKPSILYFERCFAKIPGFDANKAMIVGDSLTSDIRGGINAGIATCWVNPKHKAAGEIKPDYEIENLSQLENLLKIL